MSTVQGTVELELLAVQQADDAAEGVETLLSRAGDRLGADLARPEQLVG